MGRQRDLPVFSAAAAEFLWCAQQLRGRWPSPAAAILRIANIFSPEIPVSFSRWDAPVQGTRLCKNLCDNMPLLKDVARRPVSRVLSAPQVSPECGTTIPLGRALQRASRDQPGRRGGKPLYLAAPPPLFGLAPGGVYPAAPVARGAVRSCRTVSPLPAGRLAALARAVCFLWHFPWGRPRRPLAGTVFPWSPDFPLQVPRVKPGDKQRPSGRLARPDMCRKKPEGKGPHGVTECCRGH